jgi:hypothetical protein
VSAPTYAGSLPELVLALEAYSHRHGLEAFTMTQAERVAREGQLVRDLLAALEPASDRYPVVRELREAMAISYRYWLTNGPLRRTWGICYPSTNHPLPDYSREVGLALARLRADAHRPEPGEATAWCSECRTRRVVEDDRGEEWYEGRHTVAARVVSLQCGHDNVGPTRIVGASPGGESASEAMADAARSARLERQHAYDARDPW